MLNGLYGIGVRVALVNTEVTVTAPPFNLIVSTLKSSIFALPTWMLPRLADIADRLSTLIKSAVTDPSNIILSAAILAALAAPLGFDRAYNSNVEDALPACALRPIDD